MSRVISKCSSGENGTAIMDLPLRIADPLVLGYLQRFEGDDRLEKAQEALRVGVIALQQAIPTLDTEVVREKFAAFEKELGEQFSAFLGEGDGVLPRSLDRFFGERGLIAGLFTKHFDPTDGRLAKLIEDKVGPKSEFAQALDPK